MITPMIVQVLDDIDLEDMQEEITRLASRKNGGGAHVYMVPAKLADRNPTFLISGKPLTSNQVIRYYRME